MSFLARDPETRLPRRRLLLDLDRLHMRVRSVPCRHQRTMASTPDPGPSNTASTRPSGALRTHPAMPSDARLLRATRPEEHPLHPAGHEDMDAPHDDSLPHADGRLHVVTTYDERTALLVVDIQNDFADPSGTLAVDGGDVIVPRVNQEIAEAQDAGALVVYTQDWHPPSTPHFFKDGGIWPEHCVQDTWGAEFHPDLARRGRGRPQGRRRPRRLLRLQRPRPRERRDGAHHARGAAPRTRDRATGDLRPGDGLLRRRDRARRADARVPCGGRARKRSAPSTWTPGTATERSRGCGTPAPRSSRSTTAQLWHCGQKYALRPPILTLWIGVRQRLHGRPSRP